MHLVMHQLGKRLAMTSHGAVFCLVLMLLILPPVSYAGSFGVTPIRLDLDRATKTGAIKISNDADDTLQVQMQAFEWTQDAEGKDHYEASADLIFFPKIMGLEKQAKRLLRVGIKIPALEKEKTYRLFIEEIPEASKTESQGTQVAVKLRFGVPIFVKPLKEEPQGEIEDLALAAGNLTMVVKNTGNEHFIINSISITSGELFATELQGWYLLTGASRAYSVTIPPEICNKLSQVNVAIKTDKLGLQRSAAVNQSMCQP